MHVREFSPMKESRSTWVSLLALKGVWGLLRPRALMHSWNKSKGTMSPLSPRLTVPCSSYLHAVPPNLESQKAFVDLSSLQSSLAVGTRGVGPPLVPCQVNEGELAVHLALPPENDLENGVAP